MAGALQARHSPQLRAVRPLISFRTAFPTPRSRTPPTRPNSVGTTGAPLLADAAGSMISTIRPPGAPRSSSTTRTSTNQHDQPARSVTEAQNSASVLAVTGTGSIYAGAPQLSRGAEIGVPVSDWRPRSFCEGFCLFAIASAICGLIVGVAFKIYYITTWRGGKTNLLESNLFIICASRCLPARTKSITAASRRVLTKRKPECVTQLGPRTRLVVQVADFSYAACCPQIFILRVSGIKNRLSTKHTSGTAIG